MTRRGLTLLEVLLAAVLLAAVVIACLPLMRPAAASVGARPDPTLAKIARDTEIAPPGGQIVTVESAIGVNTHGTWRIVTNESGYGIAWVPAPETDEATP